MSQQLIEVTNVSISYNGARAIRGASMSIHSGDFLGIVGPSGSGKTSLLRVAAGALRPDVGTVKRRRGLRIGYVSQVESVNWFFPVTVLEVVLMGSVRPRLVPWSSVAEKQRAEAILEQLGIWSLRDRHIRALSGGQQQRVFIARALMGSPQVLMLDEPTAGVDVATRHDVLHLLHDLNHEENLAIVITTHDLNGIAAHMHELICLNKEVIASGDPAKILSPDVLERTYGAPMDVLSHGGMPVVVEHLEAEEARLFRAHHEH